MIIRKTVKTAKVMMFTERYDLCKSTVLREKTTYWFLFIPVYTKVE